MKRQDLVAHVAAEAGFSKADAMKAVDAVLSGISAALSKGDEVRLVGFGAFYVAERPASEGRNPRTGEKISIAASRQAKFKAGSDLKLALNGRDGPAES